MSTQEPAKEELAPGAPAPAGRPAIAGAPGPTSMAAAAALPKVPAPKLLGPTASAANIVRAMRQDSADAPAQVRGLRALSDLLTVDGAPAERNAAVAAVCEQLGVCQPEQLVLRTMGRHAGHVDVQMLGNAILKAVLAARAQEGAAARDEHIDAAFATIATKVLAQALRRHPGEADLVTRACENLAALPRGGEVDAVEDAFQGIVHAVLPRHSDNAAVLRGAVGALLHLLSAGEANQTAFLGLKGGLDAIVEVMKRQPDDVEVQIRCCTIFGRGGLGDHIQKKGSIVGDVDGALDALVHALRRFPAVEVQHEAFFSLLGCTEDSESKENVAAIVKIDGMCETILKAVQNYPKQVEVQKLAISVLVNCANPPVGVAAELAKVDGGPARIFDTIVRTMQQHLDSPEMQLVCVSALANFAFSSELPGTKEFIPAINLTSGLHQAVVESMRRYPNNYNIQQSGCAVFVKASSPRREAWPTDKAIVAAGAIEQIVAALQKSRGFPQIQLLGAAALYHLTGGGKLKSTITKIKDAGGVSVLAGLLEVNEKGSQTYKIANVVLKACGVHKYTFVCGNSTFTFTNRTNPVAALVLCPLVLVLTCVGAVFMGCFIAIDKCKECKEKSGKKYESGVNFRR